VKLLSLDLFAIFVRSSGTRDLICRSDKFDFSVVPHLKLFR